MTRLSMVVIMVVLLWLSDMDCGVEASRVSFLGVGAIEAQKNKTEILPIDRLRGNLKPSGASAVENMLPKAKRVPPSGPSKKRNASYPHRVQHKN
ncbi:hypothetical protein SUGI_0805580 [Cryptomeria japonica]|nr:hypothetical protein SUGI_0805580 [Cryptomeria japonica]